MLLAMCHPRAVHGMNGTLAIVRSMLFAVAFACAAARAAEPVWERIAGAPGTTCALGTPFAFWVHRGSPQRLVVYLRGGGACWSRSTCDPDLEPTYVSAIGQWEPVSEGLLALEREDNPLHDATVVYVPYCTGDVHLGSREVTYDGGFVVRHRGRDNVRAALDWAFASVAAPDVVLVAGESAGSLPSPVYAVAAARRYPQARIVQIGDGAGAFRAAPSFALWGATESVRRDPDYAEFDPAAPSYLALYALAGKAVPRLRLTQINAADDAVQKRYLALRGNADTRVHAWLDRNLTLLRATLPGFRTYTMPGTDHTILLRPQFYTASVDGVSLRNWVARLLAGEEVADVGAELLKR
jgi:hypothetical protein